MTISISKLRGMNQALADKLKKSGISQSDKLLEAAATPACRQYWHSRARHFGTCQSRRPCPDQGWRGRLRRAARTGRSGYSQGTGYAPTRQPSYQDVRSQHATQGCRAGTHTRGNRKLGDRSQGDRRQASVLIPVNVGKRRLMPRLPALTARCPPMRTAPLGIADIMASHSTFVPKD